MPSFPISLSFVWRRHAGKRNYLLMVNARYLFSPGKALTISSSLKTKRNPSMPRSPLIISISSGHAIPFGVRKIVSNSPKKERSKSRFIEKKKDRIWITFSLEGKCLDQLTNGK